MVARALLEPFLEQLRREALVLQETVDALGGGPGRAFGALHALLCAIAVMTGLSPATIPRIAKGTTSLRCLSSSTVAKGEANSLKVSSSSEVGNLSITHLA